MFWCSSVQSGIKYCQNMCASSSSILRSNIRLILSNQWINLSPLIRYIQCDCHLQLFINKNKTKKYYCRNSSTIKQKIIVIDTPNTQKHSRLLSWYRHFNGTYLSAKLKMTRHTCFGSILFLNEHLNTRTLCKLFCSKIIIMTMLT
jgi:hypothetical protein